jgi:hypothetical protein
MVSKFIEKLEREQYNLQVKVTKDIVQILNRKNNDVDVDIELLEICDTYFLSGHPAIIVLEIGSFGENLPNRCASYCNRAK